MDGGSSTLVGLLFLVWGTLAVLVVTFLRLAMHPDAGYGAAGRTVHHRRIGCR